MDVFDLVAGAITLMLAAYGVSLVKRVLRDDQPETHDDPLTAAWLRGWSECYEPRRVGPPRMVFWWRPRELAAWARCDAKVNDHA